MSWIFDDLWYCGISVGLFFFTALVVHDMRMRNTTGETVVISPFSSLSSYCSDCLARCLAFYTCLDRGSAFLLTFDKHLPSLVSCQVLGEQ